MPILNTLPFRAWILYFCFTYPGCRFACPGATRSIGLSARLGYRLPWVGLIAIYMRAKERIFEENSKRAGVPLQGFEADLYIFKQISQYLIKSVQLYLHPVCNIWDLSRGALQCGLMLINVLHGACVARCGIVINACASRNWFCILELTHSVQSTPLTTISTATLWKNH